MPQRISDEEVTRGIDGPTWPAEYRDVYLDLRDARAEIVALTNERNGWGDRCQEAEALLIIAVEALELVADQNDAAYPKQIAQRAIDRIK